jgi:formylglycine-generating enzyme required for sulfatase activity
LALAAALAVSCKGETLPPYGQLVVYVTTDATLPPAPGEPPTPGDAPPLFDRLVVDLFAPSETDPCAGCSREFAPTRTLVDDGQASFGFVPHAGLAGYRARVRLYRTAGEAAGPRVRSTIESVVLLPVTADEGITEVTVVLHTDDVGQPRGTLDAPVDPDPGPAPRGLVGTWHADARRACDGDPRSGEACMPGATLWMGDPLADEASERLAVVSPFFVDVSEVTVAAYRASGLAKLDVPANPITNSSDNPRCNFTLDPSPLDDYPVNCLSVDYAEPFCAKRGARLISEAEFELVAGGRSGFTYPWGDELPACDDAVWGRSDDTTLLAALRPCANAPGGVGSMKVGTGKRDRVALAGGDVVDLAGNVAEWTRDAWSPPGRGCFIAPGPLVDFVCAGDHGGDATQRALRGGDWGDIEFALRATIRVGSAIDQRSTRIGVRCTRAG